MADLTGIAEALAAEQPRRTKASRDQFGTVALDAEGAPTVKLDGGEDYAPCTCMVGVHHGDRVMAHVVDHRLVVFANVTAPTTDDATALAAVDKADAAAEAADAAGIAAAGAQQSAEAAAGAASAAQSSADAAAGAAAIADQKAADAATAAATADQKAVDARNAASTAQASADRANTYSNAALDQLGVVQDVAGILTWASEQGAFARTSDTAIVDGKVYFTFDGTDYTPVVEPDAAQLSTYYELDMSGSKQAMNEYIMAHLAVTSRGLWVLPSGKGSAVDEQHAAGYKMLLASDGSYLYDSAGVLVRSDTASGTDFASSRDWHVGGDEAYIFYDASERQITIGGSSIHLGSTKTLSELVAEVDNDLDFKVEDSYSQDGLEVTLAAHVYKGGVDVAPLHPELYPDSCFAWYRKNENGYPQNPIGNGRTITLQRSVAGYGAAIKCVYTPVNDAGLLTGDDDQLTTQDGEPLTARTPSGDYVRVADLTVETIVFDTDKVMLVGSEDEHLVSIATLKETFGDGDYERLSNKPSIEGVTLSGDKTFPELGIFQRDQSGYDVPDDYTLSTMDINALWANSVAIGA